MASNANIVSLQKVKKIIASGWTRGTYARDAHGRPVSVDNPKAVRFCLRGACLRATLTAPRRANIIICLLMVEANESFGLALWNDYTAKSKAAVIALIDRTIATCRKSQKRRSA